MPYVADLSESPPEPITIPGHRRDHGRAPAEVWRRCWRPSGSPWWPRPRAMTGLRSDAPRPLQQLRGPSHVAAALRRNPRQGTIVTAGDFLDAVLAETILWIGYEGRRHRCCATGSWRPEQSRLRSHQNASFRITSMMGIAINEIEISQYSLRFRVAWHEGSSCGAFCGPGED